MRAAAESLVLDRPVSIIEEVRAGGGLNVDQQRSLAKTVAVE